MEDKRKSDPKKLGGKRGFVSVEVEKNTYLKLSQSAKTDNMSVRMHINKKLEEIFEKEQMVSTIAPLFKLVSFTDSSFIIKEEKITNTELHKKDRNFIVVDLWQGRLWCETDKKDDCIHVRYVLMLPQIVTIKDELKEL